MSEKNSVRTAKEIHIPNKRKNGFKVKYGSLDKKNPDILYVRSRTTITPSIKKSDYSKEILSVKNKFVHDANDIILLSDYFEDRFICNIEISEKSLAYGKKSHLKYDVYLKPLENKNFEEYYDDINNIVNKLNVKLSFLLETNNLKIG